MSLIPINNRENRISNTSSNLRNQFPNFPFPLDLWNGSPFPFPFPFPPSLSRVFPDFDSGNSMNTSFDWRETPHAHVLTASLLGFDSEGVLVELQDDRFLQISTETGSFMSRFKIPETGNIEELNAFMEFGVLTVFVPKFQGDRPDVRVIEITGGDNDNE